MDTIKFLGASVINFQSNLGWGESVSELTVNLVEDRAAGDDFIPPQVGTPLTFSAGSFEFRGILRNHNTKTDTSGKNIRTVTLTDPRNILSNTQVILSNYVGGIGTISNVLNVYGYLENKYGFGGSQINEAGIPWRLVQEAIHELTGQLTQTTIFGKYLEFKGYGYDVQLHTMPTMPDYYRINGPSQDLLSIIATVCDDAGYDFFVKLVGGSIVVQTVERYFVPNLTAVKQFIDMNQGSTAREERGIELRDEYTTSIVVGGDVTTLYRTDKIAPYWGNNIQGDPIINTGLSDEDSVTLNALEVLDILGSVNYTCSIMELRIALVDIDNWIHYIHKHKKPLFDRLNGPSITIDQIQKLLDLGILKDKENMKLSQFINDEIANLEKFGNYFIETGLRNIERMYGFVRKAATEYMGKKFAVRVPFVLYKTEPETGRIITSYSPSPEGGYLPEGSNPLGLSDFNEDILQAPDGRFLPFVKYNNYSVVELSSIESFEHVAYQDNGLFMQGSISPDFVYVPLDNTALLDELNDIISEDLNSPSGTKPWLGLDIDINSVIDQTNSFTYVPAVILELPQAVYTAIPQYIDASGIIKAFSLPSGEFVSETALENLLKQGAFFDVHWAPIMPDSAAVPLRSNLLTYGPWVAGSVSGKVKFQHNPELVPWNYGGYEVMNLAGQALADEAVTLMQESENGYIEIPGLPQYNLGTSLLGSGPIITDITVSYDTRGVTTGYRLQTHIPRFGVLGKLNSDRITRTALSLYDQKRIYKNELRAKAALNNILGQGFSIAAFRSRYLNKLNNITRALQKNTPHNVLAAHVGKAIDASGDSVTALSMTYHELLPFLDIKNSGSTFNSRAAMDWSGLVRPFSTDPNNNYMSKYVEPVQGVPDSAITANLYNPFKCGNDIDVYVWGDNPSGINAYLRLNNIITANSDIYPSNVRPLALRGPLVISGWGHNLHGRIVPFSHEADYLRRSRNWRTGPVDLLWDHYRGIWTCHGTVKGITKQSIGPGGSGYIELMAGSAIIDQMLVHNWFSADIKAELKIVAQYIPLDGKWYIIAADCA